MAQPKVGNIIEHSEPGMRRVASGKVVQLLGSQFVYEVHKITENDKEKIYTKNKSIRMCLYNESWKQI